MVCGRAGYIPWVAAPRASPHHALTSDTTMTSTQIQIVFLLLTVSYTFGQYDTYEPIDEEEDHEENDRPKTDYSQYFGGLGRSIGPGAPTQAAEETAGFVQPLDFTGFLAGRSFGIDGLAGGASQQVFQTPGGPAVALPPLSSGGFPVQNEQLPENDSGFVGNNINFRSLFDTSGSASEHGFRPQDFLPKESLPASSTQGSHLSPGFASLQHDVDREVNYQRKEEAAVEKRRSGSRRAPVEEDDDDESDDFEAEFESEDSPHLDPEDRVPQRYSKKPYEEDEERHTSSDKIKSHYDAPYSSVSQIHYPRTEARAVHASSGRPLSAIHESDDDEYPLPKSNRPSKERQHSRPRLSPSKSVQPRYPSRDSNLKNPVYDTHSPYKQHSKPHSSQYRPGAPRSSKRPKTYSSPRNLNPHNPHRAPIPPGSSHGRNAYSNRSPSSFRASPRDPYSESLNRPHDDRNTDYISNPHRDKSEGHPRSRLSNTDELYQISKTDYPRVSPHKLKQPIASATESKKTCRKIQKKIDPDDFKRFKRQQMTCYICTNHEKGNKYEECSYESEPKDKSFYKGGAEAYVSETVSPPTAYRARERRSVRYDSNKPLQRYVRQYNPDYEPEEQGHGPENYRFGPEYFQDEDEVRHRTKGRREEYEEPEDDEEESDIETEYQPPERSTSTDDSCHKVKKDGIICMVCENPKTGGSYEQCSYASEPEENRYEYAKQSTFGSKKRPVSSRYKRYTEKVNRKIEINKRREPYIKQEDQPNKYRGNRRNDDFKDGKLKRKKVRRGGYEKRPTEYSESKNTRRTDAKESDIPKVVGLDPFFYGSPGKPYNPDDYDDRGRKIKRQDEPDDDEADTNSAEEDEDFTPTYEDSFFRLFPELEGTDPYTGESLERTSEEKPVKEEGREENYPVIPYEEVEDEEESESNQKSQKVKPEFEYGVDVPEFYFDDDESKKDLEKALDEFIQKNRSECKKVMKDKMTCYECLDKKGMQHEECMFVAASEPKSKHLAYHEKKESRVTPKENNTISNGTDSSGSENGFTKEPVNTERHSIRRIEETAKPVERKTRSREKGAKENVRLHQSNTKRKDKSSSNTDAITEHNAQVPILMVTDNEKQPAITYDIMRINPKDVHTHSVIPTDITSRSAHRVKRKPKVEMIAAESQNTQGRENRRKNQGKRQRESPDEEDQKDEDDNEKETTSTVKPNYNSIPPDPEGFDEREGPEGAYSHETEPVYDSILKITLPKYMLTRSEHEQVFDEVLRSG